MRYAISYVSTAKIDLPDQGVQDIMTTAVNFNKAEKITGLLLYNERNFFQLIEGEKKTIEDLYERIVQDSRHQNIIKILEKPVFKNSLDGYLTDFITDKNKFEQSRFEEYLHYIQVLEPESQKSLKKVIEMMMI